MLGLAFDGDRVAVCREFAATLAAPRSMGLLPSVTALCEQELCYHSCGGVDGVTRNMIKHRGDAAARCSRRFRRGLWRVAGEARAEGRMGGCMSAALELQPKKTA